MSRTNSKFLPFKIQHIDVMEIKEYEKTHLNLERLQVVDGLGICMTVLYKGCVLAIVGAYPIIEGVMNVFVVPSIYSGKYKFAFIRSVLWGIQVVIDNFDVHRLQTESKKDPITKQWMELLGFQCEGTLVHYTKDGQDYDIWARVV